MGSENVAFDAVVIAAVGVVLGVAYLLGAMLALLGNGGESVLLLTASVPVTATVSVLLLLTGGFLGTGHRYGRWIGMMAFGAVVVFGRPTLSSPDSFAIAQGALALLLVLYLVVRNPVPRTERSSIDESTSATRVGSTIR